MEFLGHLRLRTKLTLLLGLSALGLILSIGAGAFQMHQRMLDDRVDKLRAVVQSTIAFALSLETRVVAHQLTHEQALALLRDDIHAMRFDGGAGYLSVQAEDANGGTIVLVHGANPAREGKPSDAKDGDGRPVSDLIAAALDGHDEGVFRAMFPKPGQTVPLLKLSYVARFAPWKAVFLAGAYVDDLDSDFRAILWQLAIIGGSILLMTLLCGWLINRDITGSLGLLRNAMDRLAHGELTAEIPGTGRRDEVGDMATAVLVFRSSMNETESLRAAQEAIKVQAAADHQADLNRMADSFEAKVGSLVGMLSSASTELEATARSMTRYRGPK